MFKIIFLLLISSISPQLLAEVVGITCLQNKKGQKVVLIHDKHDLIRVNNENIKLHQNELIGFINALSALANQSSFYIEFPYKTTNFKGTKNTNTIHFAIIDALKQDMKNGSIEYIPFDQRTESEFWIREMFLHPKVVIEALKNHYSFPKEFKEVTIQNYLSLLQLLEKDCQELIKQLPADIKLVKLEKIQLYKKIQNFIEEKIIEHNLNIKQHMLDLIEKLYISPSIENKFFEMTEVQSIFSDIFLLDHILNNNKPLIIVHAGAYHTQHLEKNLLTAGFVNVFEQRKLTEGLNTYDLQKITWPASISSSFISPVYEFLCLCNVCGKESSSKCSICKKTYYCTVDCQRKNWPNHKIICRKT